MAHVTSANDNGSPTSPAASPAQLAKARIQREVNERLGESQSGLPVWIRPPKGGTERFSGFSRSKLYELADKRLIRSVSIREPGAVKGTRLFNLQSILGYIESCEAESLAGKELR